MRPHLSNLHEDARLCNTLLYGFDDGITTIGRRDPKNPPKVLARRAMEAL